MTDGFYRAISTGFVLPFLPEAQRQNEVVIEVIAGAVATYARGTARGTGETAAVVRRSVAAGTHRL
ncbi:hypothetical protein [Lentzea sp. CA-135723]|uniref:hypothetical protein n=1 Tax=Lentzea sp. CA-135723 TaxID=3239950 RepID=UPI003D8C0FE3